MANHMLLMRIAIAPISKLILVWEGKSMEIALNSSPMDGVYLGLMENCQQFLTQAQVYIYATEFYFLTLPMPIEIEIF